MKNQRKQIFTSHESDFYHYLVEYGNIALKTCKDYVTRLRFLSEFYSIDSSLTETKIKEIISREEVEYTKRDRYNYKKAPTDFADALKKFLKYIQSGYSQCLEELEIREENRIRENATLKDTERTALIKSRVGQGDFRKDLIDYWQGCALSDSNMINILVASHIKPWRVSDNSERLDVFNGLLLLPNYDKLFDLGYISFLPNGEIVISSLLPKEEYSCLNLDRNLRLSHIDDKHQPYLKYHRDYCFMN